MAGRKAWMIAGTPVAVVAILVVSYVVVVIASPYESRQIPADCTANSSHLPATLRYDIPGSGPGTLVTSDSTTAVVLVANYGDSPLSSEVFLISKSSGTILRSLTFNDDVVIAGLHAGAVYLFNDKILYLIDASSGETVHPPFESDNYRGVFFSNGLRYLQTSLLITTIGPGSNVTFNLHLSLAGIAFGCAFA
jgi:hypothetical protein